MLGEIALSVYKKQGGWWCSR